jgi:hypothetical protein
MILTSCTPLSNVAESVSVIIFGLAIGGKGSAGGANDLLEALEVVLEVADVALSPLIPLVVGGISAIILYPFIFKYI